MVTDKTRKQRINVNFLTKFVKDAALIGHNIKTGIYRDTPRGIQE